MVSLIKRAILFLVPFSLIFLYIHFKFEATITRASENGLSAFYSADGIIFGLIVAFVIQREWETWSNLSESVSTEIDTIREMWKWSTYTDPELCNEAHAHIEAYLKAIVTEWNSNSQRERSNRVDAELDSIRGMLVKMTRSMDILGLQLLGAFTNLVAARNQRLNFSNEHMPRILKRIVILADILLIILSLFIGVNSIYLDYIFTLAISLLAFALIIVVDDLDNPFRPGAWHLTTHGYEVLLDELTRPK